MLFEETERVIYAKSPLREVICQLRFPTDLSISAQPPVEFQKAIRSLFPNYSEIVEEERNIEVNASEGGISDAHFTQRKTPNFAFESEDRAWRVNLTSNFVAFSSTAYTTWEDFKERFDLPLNSFLATYKPPFFNRAGLRYLDVIDRHELALDGTPWAELLKPEILGMLSSPSIPEPSVRNTTQQTEFALDETTTMVVRSGLGSVGGDTNTCFIIDADTFRADDVAADGSIVEKLDLLHAPVSAFFRQSITSRLHDVMEPSSLEDCHA